MSRHHGLTVDVSTFCRYIAGVETIGLRELNQNPSKVVARVRAGESIIVTDRGRPLLRMVPEAEHPDTLARMVSSGQARPPTEQGMPELIAELAPDVESLADLVVDDRDRERNR
jgi:prevent-host-death family protein